MPSVVGFAVIHCGLSLAGDAPRLDAVVRVAADDDGVVPGCPGGGATVGVAADDDGIVPGRPGVGVTIGGVVLDVADDGAFEDPTERRDIADGERGTAAVVNELARVRARTLPMESLARRPQWYL